MPNQPCMLLVGITIAVRMRTTLHTKGLYKSCTQWVWIEPICLTTPPFGPGAAKKLAHRTSPSIREVDWNLIHVDTAISKFRLHTCKWFSCKRLFTKVCTKERMKLVPWRSKFTFLELLNKMVKSILLTYLDWNKVFHMPTFDNKCYT